ncbi:MAG: hypothetical protein AAF998_11305 [Bacteroidota bacterium]
MRKILCIQLGRTGLFLGDSFWTALRDDHGLKHPGKYPSFPKPRRFGTIAKREAYKKELEKYRKKRSRYLFGINTFFDGQDELWYTPRALLVDTDPTMRDNASNFAVPPTLENWITGNGDADANWAKGYYSRGPELIDQIVAAAEKPALENGFAGVILFHSLGGGTGSGLGTLLLERLRAGGKFRTIATVSVLPSTRMQENVLEPYNAVLGLSKIAKLADLCFLVDNEALRNLAATLMHAADPTYPEMNMVAGRILTDVARLISGIGLPRLAGYLLPEPWMNLISISAARFHPQDTSLDPRDLLQQAFSVHNGLVAFPSEAGKALVRSLFFRGSLNHNTAMKELRRLQDQLPPPFPDWPSNYMVPHFQTLGPTGLKNNLTMVSNHTGVKTALIRLLGEFDQLYRKRRHVASYTSQGMRETEFLEAVDAIRDLIQAYQQIEAQQVDRDEDEAK